jgi:hypothetical protein
MDRIDFWVEKKMEVVKNGNPFTIQLVDVPLSVYEQIKETDFIMHWKGLPLSKVVLKKLGVNKILKYNGIYWLVRVYNT